MKGERVCLPTATRTMDLLSNSSLHFEVGVDSILLRIQHTMLPQLYAEDVTVDLMVDMKQELNQLHQQEDCHRLWHVPTLTTSAWQPDNTEMWEGELIQGRFGMDTVTQHFSVLPAMPANTQARISISLVFFGQLALEGNGDDSIYVAVNGIVREVHWPLLGSLDETQINRSQVCERGEFASDHCRGNVSFDAESDANGRVQVDIVGTGNFSWAFYNFSMKFAVMETNLTYTDLILDCQLGPVAAHSQYIERSGFVGVQAVGSWDDHVQTLYRFSFPLQLYFSTLVTGTYMPLTTWVEKEFPAQVHRAGILVGTLELFMTEEYDEEQRVPRYEQGSRIWARHCLLEREYHAFVSNATWNWTMDVDRVWLSESEDPTEDGAEVFNFSTVITGPNRENRQECVYFSVEASAVCEWCHLHVFSNVAVMNRRLVEENGGVRHHDLLSSVRHDTIHEWDEEDRRLEHHDVLSSVIREATGGDRYSINSVRVIVDENTESTGRHFLTSSPGPTEGPSDVNLGERTSCGCLAVLIVVMSHISG